MDNSLSPFTTGLQNLLPYKKTTTIAPTAAAAVSTGTPRHNPFLAAMDTNSDIFKETYGKNRPLDKPMLLGYLDDKPMYGGSKLFILY